MKRLASSIILCSLLLFCACQSAVEDSDGDEALLVNLDVSVALSDVSGALTKASEADYAGAANDNEKMQTLRIVIVRPNLVVEANRLIDLKAAAALKHEMERFEVVGNERKRIYLFVNEEATVTDKATGSPRRLVDYDFNAIQAGSYFPINTIAGLKISLEDSGQQLEGALPMSEQHEFFVTKEQNQSCKLFVTRAAVKFTFHITNNSSKPVTLDKLTINRVAHEEWYLPRVTYGEPDANTGQREITAYEVPAGVGHYSYDRNTTAPNDVTVDGKGGEKVLNPIYLLESQYTDAPDSEGRNYSIGITLDGISKELYLPNLPALPRNTHVVVNITCDVDAVVSYEVDVIPYSEVVLEPGFGL